MKKYGSYLIAASLFVMACQKIGPQVKADIWADYRKAYDLLGKQPDSAFYYFNELVTQAKDSLPVATACYNMAIIESDAGDYFGAQESLSQSLKFLNEKDPKHHATLAMNYNELGVCSYNLKNYDQALAFYDRAAIFVTEPAMVTSISNNKANAFQKKGAYKKALELYRANLAQTTKKRTYARLLTNIATTEWLADPDYQAAANLLKALAIRIAENDTWGQNSSYAHLADYYMKREPDSALFFATKMYAIAKSLNSPDDKAEALQKLIKLAPTMPSRQYFNDYTQLNDSLQTARNAAKNQFALIRYDSEKNKVANLKLQQENTAKRIWIIGIISVFGVLTALAIRFYRRRKRKQELETQFAVLETQHKVSKKVHDTLANDIYRILKRVQNDPVLEKNWLEEQVTEAYELARDLSYEIKMDPDEFFAEKIAGLLMDFSTEGTSVLVKGCEKEWWQKVSVTHRAELKYVLQELMVNMQKHSRAHEVIIRFEDSGQHLFIGYADDGIGFPEHHQSKNGLKNTGNRINAIGGEIKFASIAGQGLEVTISLPAL